jgi:hypothetical protein
VRNANANAPCCQLIDRLGEEAPAVAAFYVNHNAQFYTRALRQLDLLVRDAEKVRTEWATGQTMTAERRQMDRSQSNFDVAEAVKRKLRNVQ